ncbi:outer membrane beta-barrel protein [uncultured Winogradskyella sp.]|uniref:outer membrane beta-barrel protein n=1 Tax=uncultured Winogradskyella sp. TaxID=395353 RepID=UPI002634B0F9|nr:outer membrane beta-barrel protein [uncultured Winogradskyella sp.]
MSDKKHIDRLFQEKFKDFDVMPNEAVWEGIEARLEKKKKKQRIIPIWWQLGGVAAAIVLMFAVGNMLINNNPDTPIIVNTDKQQSDDTKNNDIDKASQKDTTQIASEDIIDSNENNKSSTVNETEKASQKQLYKSNNKEDIVAYQNLTSEKSKENRTNLTSKNNNENAIKTTVASTNNIKSNTTDNLEIKSESEINEIINSSTKSATTVASTEKEDGKTEEDKASEILKEKEIKEEKGQDIEEAIAEAKKINEEEKELRRWSIAPNVAPVYFNSLGQGSSIDAQFNDNNTSSDISMSYGVKGSYAVNNRLKVTAGINRVSFNNTTNDVIALSDNAFASRSSNSSNGNLENVKLNSSVNHASLMLLSRSSISNNTVSEAINTLQTGNLEQRFGFIEIPLEVEYRLVDKKLGVNLSGGFSTLLLNENEIFADVNGQSTQIGEANNLRDTSFSANFGVGVDYSLTDKININLEPKFKYQINTFNNTSGDFRPFFIGVYTGLSFKF